MQWLKYQGVSAEHSHSAFVWLITSDSKGKSVGLDGQIHKESLNNRRARLK